MPVFRSADAVAPAGKPTAPARNPDRFSPIFVLATARSYTSVVTTMVGQHPELAGLPELKLFCHDTVRELEASLPHYWLERGVTHRSPGLVRALAHYEFGDQTPDSLSSARAWLQDRAHWSGAHVLDVLLEHVWPRVAIEKSPEHVVDDDALMRLASAYPTARYLHVTRHPVTTLYSLQEYWTRIVPGYSVQGAPMSLIASWVEAQCRILRFSATLPRHRYLQVKGEDVLNDTGPQLRSIARWLGIRADEDALEAMAHPEASPFARFVPADSGIAGGNDPAFLRDPTPHRIEVPRTLDPPLRWEGNSHLWEMAVDVAGRLGYP
jgi:hypothetical protein